MSGALSQWTSSLSLSTPVGSSLALLLLAIFWYNYTTKRDEFAAHSRHDGAGQRTPPTFPYFFPLLGTLPMAYLWNPKSFLLDSTNFFQCAYPVRVKVLTYEFYAVQGPEFVKDLFKGSGGCTSIPFVKFALGYAFGLPAKALRLYDDDDSGGGHVPHPDSRVEARNRVDYRDHTSLVRFLEGPGLTPFNDRFEENITHRLCELHQRIGHGVEHHDDLMKVVQDESMVSIFTALCGPYLLRLNPTFLEDFAEFDRNLQTYLQGVPWILAPGAYAARKRVVDAVKLWQQYAREHSGQSDRKDDEFWGSSFFRERQQMFLEMDGFDYDAIASADFGAIWASRNAVAATSWASFDIYRDPDLLARVRAEVDSCALKGPDGCTVTSKFDIDRLLRLPMLQAVYAETLRLRMHFYIIRMTDRAEMRLQDWVIPRRKVIVTPTTVAHMNTDVWRTGLNNEHPVDQFWAGRFLHPKNANDDEDPEVASADSMAFSAKGLEGSWIPYGGGPRQCPGRHFAKRQIILTTALVVSLFDCEILENSDVQEDFTLKGFGGGMSYALGKVPIRLRRREK
ncbi:hypothetical protein N0V82_001953 [Gnomoniopsis sp. IMI 355080]|nr:hypothetical protein N0V82_001953 [Gnomoniopsis sp. IMI 355080]